MELATLKVLKSNEYTIVSCDRCGDSIRRVACLKDRYSDDELCFCKQCLKDAVREIEEADGYLA